jgi:hypothetical protein
MWSTVMRTTVLYKPTRVLNWTETWIDSSVKDAQNLPGGFNIYHDDRNLNGGGDILMDYFSHRSRDARLKMFGADI